MKLSEDDQAFAAAMAKTLQANETELSPEVTQRLQAARRAAVAEMASQAGSRRWSGPYWLVPAGGVAAAVAAVLLWPNEPAGLPDFDENEFAAAIEMDMLDDIELVAWMLEEESNAG